MLKITQKVKLNKSALKKIIVPVVFILLLLFFNIITSGRYLMINNLTSVISRSIIPALLAWGISFLFITGIIDLSIGAIFLLASNVAGILGLQIGYPGLILGGLITSVLLMYINTFLFLKMKIPSWVAGLGFAMIYETFGAIYSMSRIRIGKQIVELGDQLRELGNYPINIIIWILGLILFFILFNKTSIGINSIAVGDNRDITEMMGVNVNRTLLLGAISGGIFIGIAASINESYTGKVVISTGLSSISQLFVPLAIFLLAIILRKFVNLAFGIVASSFFVNSLFNVMLILGVPRGTWQEMILGIVIIIFGILSQINRGDVVK